MNRTEWIKEIREQEERIKRPLRYRAGRITGYLHELLHESFPEKAQNYGVVAVEVNDPAKVSIRDIPTYEFYLKPLSTRKPMVRVMILHKPDLAARIPGGIKNERKHYYISNFRENLERAIQIIESASK